MLWTQVERMNMNQAGRGQQQQPGRCKCRGVSVYLEAHQVTGIYDFLR